MSAVLLCATTGHGLAECHEATAHIVELMREEAAEHGRAFGLDIVENFKKAVELTTGDYIAFIGADNRAHPSFIQSRAALRTTAVAIEHRRNPKRAQAER
jgi:hypothetical protein